MFSVDMPRIAAAPTSAVTRVIVPTMMRIFAFSDRLAIQRLAGFFQRFRAEVLGASAVIGVQPRE
nr:hypothetical protein GCM10020092_027550 [Actinoplanes digitatis]